MRDSDDELKSPHRSVDQPVVFLPGMPAPMPIAGVEPAKHWDPLVVWFGPVMRAVRVWRELSLVEAARLAECSDDTLHRLECVKCDPPLDLAQRVARVYEVPLWVLIAEAARLAAGGPCGRAVRAGLKRTDGALGEAISAANSMPPGTRRCAPFARRGGCALLPPWTPPCSSFPAG